MRRIHHPFIVLVILFSVYVTRSYSQNIPALCRLTISDIPDQTAAPQSQVSDRIFTLIEVKDGQKLPIAAQIEKKGKNSFQI